MVDIELAKKGLLEKLRFDGNQERDKTKLYLDLKGVMYDINIINFLESKNIVSGADGEVECKIADTFFRYDKRLRERIYKYVAALDEYVRACILNSKIDFLDALGKKNRERSIEIERTAKAFAKMNPTEKLLEFSFRDIVNVVKYKIGEFAKLFLFEGKELSKKLVAVGDLRNKVICYRSALEKRWLKK